MLNGFFNKICIFCDENDGYGVGVVVMRGCREWEVGKMCVLFLNIIVF